MRVDGHMSWEAAGIPGSASDGFFRVSIWCFYEICGCIWKRQKVPAVEREGWCIEY